MEILMEGLQFGGILFLAICLSACFFHAISVLGEWIHRLICRLLRVMRRWFRLCCFKKTG